MSDKELILEYLREVGSITTLEAIQLFGCTRLSGRIHELRNEGYPIKSEDAVVEKRGGKRVHVTRYRMEEYDV